MLRYGIDIDEYDEMLEAQGGGCAICTAPLGAGGVRLAVDHDHSCCPGEYSCGNCVRGILCANCNRGLGLFKDDMNLFRMAIAYLSFHEPSERKAAS
ncbi:endonuclease VII domain-containing protein [Paenarthrobacter sp. NPDC089322]|uniref:endonuclease VII domain-containing protein n=1 Tax=Paenarthrobacter sp. NPDC089322 TaxID=3155065 RepID=UPI003441D669